MALIPWEGSLESLIASWNMLEFQRVKEVLNYLLMLSPKQLRQGLGISYVDGSEPAGEWNKWNITLKFKIARCRMQSLDQELRVVSPSDYLSKPPRAPMCYFIAYEHLPKTTDSPRGAHLAEILHLLPKEALRRALNLKDAGFRAKKLQWVRVSRSVVYMSLN